MTGRIFWNYMTRARCALAITLFLAGTSGCGGSVPAASLRAPDPALGRGVASADSLISAAVGTVIPGAVFLVSRDGRVVHDRAFGYAQLNDFETHRLAAPRPMRPPPPVAVAAPAKGPRATTR